MDERNEIEHEVLARITPDEAEEKQIEHAVERLSETVRRVARERGLDLEPLLVGSVAKGTYLTELDIDIFLPFPPDTPRSTLKHEGLAIGHTILPEGEERYAEHPYVSGEFDGYEVDLVPCYRVRDGSSIKSAVDRTPFHTDYVKSHLPPMLRDDVRLLKQFLKGIDVYGADERVKGFSGYLSELLVIHAGGFHPLLEEASRWRSGRVIVPEAHRAAVEATLHGTDDETEGTQGAREIERMPNRAFFRALQKRYKDDALIYIDPVDPDRNVAAAVSLPRLARFVCAARSYLRRPRRTFFFPNPLTPLSPTEQEAQIAQRGTAFVALRFHAPEVIDDILYSQLRKARRRFCKNLEAGSFAVHQANYALQTDGGRTVVFLFELFSRTLPALEKHGGPPVWHRNANKFLNKWRGEAPSFSQPYLDGERWCVDTPRKYVDAVEVIRDTVDHANIGDQLQEAALEGGYDLICDTLAIVEAAPRLLTAMINRKLPWER